MFFLEYASEQCKLQPALLEYGKTVFFAVQPRFMNVDIRLVIDVTQGALDLYLGPRDDCFIVRPNMSSALHDIELDMRYRSKPGRE